MGPSHPFQAPAIPKPWGPKLRLKYVPLAAKEVYPTPGAFSTHQIFEKTSWKYIEQLNPHLSGIVFNGMNFGPIYIDKSPSKIHFDKAKSKKRGYY